MRYMLLIYLDEQSVNETEREHCYAESAQFANQLNSSGHYLAAAPLHPNLLGMRAMADLISP